METEVLSNSCDREDGEIEDDPVEDIYVPLERPHISLLPLAASVTSSSDHEDQVQDDSSSDSDTPTVRRQSFSKTKKKVLPVAQSVAPKKKRNTIWCTDLQTDVLTDNLVNCSVDQSFRTRDVESYDYTLALVEGDKDRGKRVFQEQEGGLKRQGGKRKSDGKLVEGERRAPGGRPSKFSCHGGASRTILSLTTTVGDSVEVLARDLANKLCEEKEDLVFRAVKVIGRELAVSLFEETRTIEENGGMMIMNGTRRRTPGGVFFYLLKCSGRVPQEQVGEVFIDDRRSTAAEKKKAAREMRRQRTAKLREAMSKDDFPTLLSRTEEAIKQFKARKEEEDSKATGGEVKGEEEVKNPPPSPATDGRDNSSDGEDKGLPPAPQPRTLAAYDDNLFGSEDGMDLA